MGSGKRITVALVGLVLLAVVGWLAEDLTGHGAQDSHGGRSGPVSSSVSTAPVSPSAPRPAAASG